MHLFSVLFSKESENNSHFLQKKIFKKLFNCDVICFQLNTDETLTLIFRMFYMLIEYFRPVYMIWTMEVEYSGGGVLIFSYLILIHPCDTFGGFVRNQVEPRQLVTSELIGCRFDGPPIAVRLYLKNSAKRKRRKPPRSATDAALGSLQ